MKRTQCSFFVSSTKITCGGLSSGRQRARRRLLSPIGAMTRWKTTALASDGFTSFSSSSSDDNDGRVSLGVIAMRKGGGDFLLISHGI